MSASGIIGTFQGPRSPGTAYVLLHHYMGEIDGAFRAWGIPKGGTGGISYAIANAALSLGAEIRTEAKVTNIITTGRAATGVVLEGGEEIHADVVMSLARLAMDVHQPAREGHPGPRLRAEVMRYKYRGSSGKVNLALDSACPSWHASPAAASGCAARSRSPRRSTTWSARTTTRSTGDHSERPYIDCIIPTLVDPTMAPPGKHMMSCFVQYAPYHLADGEQWDDAERGSVRAERDRHARGAVPRHPRARSSAPVRARPKDIEDITGPDARGTSSRASSRSSSCSSTGRCPAGRATARRCPTCGCAGRRPTPAAASWARTAGSPRSSTSRRRRRDGGRPDGEVAIDVVVIGAGHNGLVAAAYLAKAGQRVTVLERSPEVGGILRNTEIAPGFTAPGIGHTVGRLRATVVKDLKLARHGLELLDAGRSHVRPAARRVGRHVLGRCGADRGRDSASGTSRTPTPTSRSTRRCARSRASSPTSTSRRRPTRSARPCRTRSWG